MNFMSSFNSNKTCFLVKQNGVPCSPPHIQIHANTHTHRRESSFYGLHELNEIPVAILPRLVLATAPSQNSKGIPHVLLL